MSKSEFHIVKLCREYDCYNNGYINTKTRYLSRLDRVYYNSDKIQLVDIKLYLYVYGCIILYKGAL